MTQLQLTAAQRQSARFLRQLLSIDDIELSSLSPQAICTNLDEHSLGGLACQMSPKRLPEGEGKDGHLVISAPALSLSKVDDVLADLSEHFTFGRFRPTCPQGELGPIAVTVEVLTVTAPQYTEALEQAALAHSVEVNRVVERPTLSQPGLLVMDMDSTVINMECIDEIAYLAGVGDKVAAVTELAMQGKLDFAQSLRERVACLAGTPDSVLEQVRCAMPLMPGIDPLVRLLQQHHWKVVIASGGFTYFANDLKARLGLDEAVANTLAIDDGVLLGRVDGEIVDASVKASTLKALAEKWQIPASQTVAMGDGANDLVMMDAAALGVAFHAKPIVRQKADTAIRFGGADELLNLLAP